MPLLYMPTIRAMIARPMTAPEKNLIYALCGLVCMHMSGKSLHVDGPVSWEGAGRFFLDECVSNRQSYDFMEDASLSAVISSFWLSTSFFEINQNRKSWLYLREALTLAQDMGLHDDASYAGLSAQEALCRQRVFWQLFVTERSASTHNLVLYGLLTCCQGHLLSYETNRLRSKERHHYRRHDTPTNPLISILASSSSSPPTRHLTSPLSPPGTTVPIQASPPPLTLPCRTSSPTHHLFFNAPVHQRPPLTPCQQTLFP